MILQTRSPQPRTVRIAGVVLTVVAISEAVPLLWIGNLGRALLHPQPPSAVVGAFLIAAAYIAYSLRHAGIRRFIGTFGWITIPAVAVAVVAGIVEEVYFRRVLMDWLQGAGVNVVLQIALSGVAFGLAHAVWGIGGGWRVARGAMAATTMMGLALAVLYAADGRIIVPCIEAHVLIDLVLEPALIVFAVDAALQRRAARSG